MASIDTACFDRASAEAEVPRKEVEKVLKGFERYLLQDIDDDSRGQLVELRKRYSNWLNAGNNAKLKIAEAKAAVEELNAFGEEPEAVVDKQVIEDLDENLDTLQAARSRFTPRPITKGGRIEVGEQERISPLMHETRRKH